MKENPKLKYFHTMRATRRLKYFKRVRSINRITMKRIEKGRALKGLDTLELKVVEEEEDDEHIILADILSDNEISTDQFKLKKSQIGIKENANTLEVILLRLSTLTELIAELTYVIKEEVFS
jgi:hypothetical protein